MVAQWPDCYGVTWISSKGILTPQRQHVERTLQPTGSTEFCSYTASHGACLVAQAVKNLPAMWEIWVWSLGQTDPLEKELATHSSILASCSPWGPKESDTTEQYTHTQPRREKMGTVWSIPLQAEWLLPISDGFFFLAHLLVSMSNPALNRTPQQPVETEGGEQRCKCSLRGFRLSLASSTFQLYDLGQVTVFPSPSFLLYKTGIVMCRNPRCGVL